MATFPDRIAIQPRPGPIDATVRVPGSKSITNRALVLAALTASPAGVILDGVLRSEDTELMAAALQQLGFRIEASWDYERIVVGVEGDAARIPASQADLFVGNSGTSMRFLTAMVALGHGVYRLDGVPRMRERPIQDLLAALQQLGVKAASLHGNGCPPVTVEACGLPGGNITIKGDVSSQFLSGLLMAAPFAEAELTISVDGPLVSLPYVEMTLAMMRQFGLQAEHRQGRHFRVPGKQQGGMRQYHIEPDASAASYFFGAAAITGGRAAVAGLPTPSLQGDVRFVEVLEQMGCTVRRSTDAIEVRGGPLHGVDVDMNDISDTVMTLAAVACFAEGPTCIRNVGHIRHKETDRLAALATELRRLGATVEEQAEALTIRPQSLRAAEIETYNDHRMAMSMALVGLRAPGVVIKNPACVAKTYPRFFEDLEKV